MNLELDWLPDGAVCRVSPGATGWQFRQTDWPRRVRDLRIMYPAVPHLCGWLRRVASYDICRSSDRKLKLLGQTPPTAFIPEFRWASRDQKPILLTLKRDGSVGRRMVAVIRIEGSEWAAKFLIHEATHLLSLLEGEVLWGSGFSQLWERFTPSRSWHTGT